MPYRATLLLCALLGALPLAAASPEPFRVSPETTCADSEIDVAPRPGGGFVAVWIARDGAEAAPEVHARLYRADGSPEGDAFRIQTEEGATARAAAVAVRPDGEMLVTWMQYPPEGSLRLVVGQIFDPQRNPLGEPFSIDPNGYLTELDAAVTPDGDYQVLGTGLIYGDTQGTVSALYVVSPEGAVLARDLTARAEFQTTLGGPALAVGDGRVYSGVSNDRTQGILVAAVEGADFVAPGFSIANARQPALAVLPGGNLVTAYTETQQTFPSILVPRSLVLEVRAPDGEVLSTQQVDAGGWTDLSPASVAVAPSGRIAVTWAEYTLNEGTRVLARGFLPDGTPAGPVRELAAGAVGEPWPWAPRVAWSGGEWTVLWQLGFGPEPGSCAAGGILGVELLVPQLLHEIGLLFQGDRFEARVAWRDPYNGGTGVGHPIRLTDDTGTFWFFREGNRELMVKVLDGRPVNGNWWVFYGSTTSVAFDLVVTDTESGEEAVYRNPPFHLASHGDTAAFPAAETETAGGPWVLAETAPASSPAPSPPGPFGQSLPALPVLPLDRLSGPLTPAVPTFDCDDPNEPGLCLGAHYEVTVRWFDPFNGGSGEGWGVPLSDDSGYFWFFDEDNAELLVKVLPGHQVNGFDWVFYGSLTNVAFEMRIYNWDNGSERFYRNPPREFRSVGDTFAFPPVAGCERQCPAGGEPVCGNDGLTYANACVAECSGRTVRHTGECTWEPPQ